MCKLQQSQQLLKRPESPEPIIYAYAYRQQEHKHACCFKAKPPNYDNMVDSKPM